MQRYARLALAHEEFNPAPDVQISEDQLKTRAIMRFIREVSDVKKSGN
jgi:hypothetical protein